MAQKAVGDKNSFEETQVLNPYTYYGPSQNDRLYDDKRRAYEIKM